MKDYVRIIVESIFDDDILNNNPVDDVVSDKFLLSSKRAKQLLLDFQKLDKEQKYLLTHEHAFVVPDNYDELIQICQCCIFVNRIYNLNFIDTSSIDTLENFWYNVTQCDHKKCNISLKELERRIYTKKSIDVSEWNVCNVTNMHGTFYNCMYFNSDISNWNVSNVTDMNAMFFDCRLFNQDISNWDVSNVSNMAGMFNRCELFNQNLNEWDVTNVVDMSNMFFRCKSFNKNLNNWNVSNVIMMIRMFDGCESFNGDITTWNVKNVSDMAYMFKDCKSFKQDLSSWRFNSNCYNNQMFYLTDYPTEILNLSKKLRKRLTARY